MLWVDCTDCSLAEEHVLMRSVSLPGAAWRCACRWRESLSPGKVKEPGRLAGEAGMELQKEPPFCRGLLGAKGSLLNGGGPAVARGEPSGEPAPGLGLPSGKGPRLLRERLSSGLARASRAAASWPAPAALAAFLGLSITFILGICSASRSGPSASLPGACLPGWPGPASGAALLLGGGSGGPGADVPDILSASAWLAAAEETSTGEWCRTGWGIREGLLLLALGRPLQLLAPPLWLLPPPLGAPPPPPPPPPLWFLWYSMGDVKAAKHDTAWKSVKAGHQGKYCHRAKAKDTIRRKCWSESPVKSRVVHATAYHHAP